MVQVKKQAVQESILAAAERLFTERGYQATTLADIAGASGVAVGNIYSYFPSKLHLLYQVYRPWLIGELDRLEERVSRCLSPRAKVEAVLIGLWQEIPNANPGLANSLMEALASANASEGKPDDLLRYTEQRVTAMLRSALPGRGDLLVDDLFAHLCLMAFDGFVINRRLRDLRDVGRLVHVFADLLVEPEVALQPISARKTA